MTSQSAFFDVQALTAALLAFLNKGAPGRMSEPEGKGLWGTVDDERPELDSNQYTSEGEPRQGLLCCICKNSSTAGEWLPKSSAAWCRAQNRRIGFDEPVRRCQAFRQP